MASTEPVHLLSVEDEDEREITLWGKVKFFAISSVGFFSEGWINNNLSFILPMIGYLYWNGGSIPTLPQDTIKAGLSIGMIVGQITFGIFGDALGRHKVYGKELAFTLFGTLMIVLMPWNGLSQNGIVAWLTIWRIVTGVGIGGGQYRIFWPVSSRLDLTATRLPMSGSLTAETKLGMSRAKLVLTSFTLYQCGSLGTAIFYLILIAGYKNQVEANLWNLQYVWRLMLGIGMIPGMLSLYERLTMKETKPYERYVAKETGLARGDHHTRGLNDQFRDFLEYFNFKTAECRRHVLTLTCTCLSWFLFDIAIYGVSLNQSNILAGIGFGTGATKWETLYNTAVGNVIITIFSVLGIVISIYLPDVIGRRAQIIGFSLLTSLMYAIWAGVQGKTGTAGLMVLFALSQIFLQIGPNACTFLIPAEVFPTRVRGMGHGISAASGKCGALLTAFAFGQLNSTVGLPGALALFCGVMFLCAVVSWWIPEVRGLTLDDIEHDLQYLARSERFALIKRRREGHDSDVEINNSSNDKDMVA
ncbi:Inorganic phosphate transporter pho84 [Saitozyma podzolica]|uniref:Inorganic phosphate transporter pho84 n=1 Tax=Saitozyma podzolica TaxID=1890683 RepID=A0A427XPR0_9TREE|nr:Inorganic phosphate transporter pho84 [Saitozyma podzolica]